MLPPFVAGSQLIGRVVKQKNFYLSKEADWFCPKLKVLRQFKLELTVVKHDFKFFTASQPIQQQ